MDEADLQFRDMLARRIARDGELEFELERRLTELQAERDLIRQRRLSGEELYQAEFGEEPPPAHRGLTSQPGPSAGAAWQPGFRTDPALGPYAGLHWTEAITAVLREAGEPLHVRRIWERLQEGGFETHARDPVRSIVSIAVRDPRMVKVAPNRYALVDADGAATEVVPPDHDVGL